MTSTVLSGTLNVTQSISRSFYCVIQGGAKIGAKFVHTTSPIGKQLERIIAPFRRMLYRVRLN